MQNKNLTDKKYLNIEKKLIDNYDYYKTSLTFINEKKILMNNYIHNCKNNKLVKMLTKNNKKIKQLRSHKNNMSLWKFCVEKNG